MKVVKGVGMQECPLLRHARVVQYRRMGVGTGMASSSQKVDSHETSGMPAAPPHTMHEGEGRKKSIEEGEPREVM